MKIIGILAKQKYSTTYDTLSNFHKASISAYMNYLAIILSWARAPIFDPLSKSVKIVASIILCEKQISHSRPRFRR